MGLVNYPFFSSNCNKLEKWIKSPIVATKNHAFLMAALSGLVSTVRIQPQDTTPFLSICIWILAFQKISVGSVPKDAGLNIISVSVCCCHVKTSGYFIIASVSVGSVDMRTSAGTQQHKMPSPCAITIAMSQWAMVNPQHNITSTFLDFFTPMGHPNGQFNFWFGSVKSIYRIFRKHPAGHLVLNKN